MTVAAYPWHRLRRLTRGQARLESAVAGWIAARSPDRLGKLVAARVRVGIVEPAAFDPYAARCQVRAGGDAIEVRGSSIGVRRVAQRILGGPAEPMAARPLGVVERAVWTLVVATALEDLGIVGEAWPVIDEHGSAATPADDPIELAVTLDDIALAVQLHPPPPLALRVPGPSGPRVTPTHAWPAWFDATLLDVPVVLGRCALARTDVPRLAVRSVVTLEPACAPPPEDLARSRPAGPVPALDVFGGVVGLSARAGALEAEVATGYVRCDMSLPDDAHVELTVGLGTTRLSLRQIADLAVGQIIQLGRPLAGPFEVRAAGRVVGRGELVEVDGELAVRIVSLGDQEL